MSELTLKDVTPQVEIVFKKLAASVITMQEKGRVLFIAKDATQTEDYTVKTYTSAVGITDITGTLKQDVIDIFDGGVKKVILLTVKTDIDTVAAVLPTLKFDWMFTNIAEEQTTVANYAKENEKFAVVYNVAKDCMHVVNFVTPSATLEDGTTVETVNILPYVAGQLAGCPYTRSIMAKELTHFSDATLPSTFAHGTCFLRFDDDLGCVKFANSYNSLTTVGENQTEDMKKIAIVEGMSRMKSDIRYAFKKSYQGKYKNIRQNQQLFYDACKYGYFEELQNARILDPNFNNSIGTDVDAQRKKWQAAGKTEAAEWTDEEVKNNTFADYVIPLVNAKFADAMEQLEMTVEME